jgi:hypothetical protein
MFNSETLVCIVRWRTSCLVSCLYENDHTSGTERESNTATHSDVPLDQATKIPVFQNGWWLRSNSHWLKIILYCIISYHIILYISCIIWYISYIVYHISYLINLNRISCSVYHTSYRIAYSVYHISYRISHVASHISYIISHITCLISYHHISYVVYRVSPITYHV